FGVLKNPGKDRDLPARQRERIDHFVILNDGELPLILRLVGGFGNLPPHPMHQLIHFRVIAEWRGAQHLTERAQSKLQLFLFGKKDDLTASRARRTVATSHTAEQTQSRSCP